MLSTRRPPKSSDYLFCVSAKYNYGPLCIDYSLGLVRLIRPNREKKLRHDKLSRQFFVRNLSNLVVILVEILVAKAIPAKKLK